MNNTTNESFLSLLRKCPILEHVWEEIREMNFEQLETDDYEERITKIHECGMNIIAMHELETGDMRNFPVKYSSKIRLPQAKCVCFSEKYQIVFISVLGSSSIAMLNEQGECIGQIKSHSLKSPWGLAAYSDFLYVTDEEKKCLMEFYIPAPHLKASIYEAKFSQPRQLAMNCHNEVWVADKRGNKVVIINIINATTEYLRDRKMKHPIDIKFSKQNALIMTQERIGISIHLCSQNSKEYLRTILQSTRVEKITCEFFTIWVDMILIPDSNPKSILAFDLEGKKIAVQRNLPSKPSCLCTTQDNLCILFPNEKHGTLKIY